MTKQLTAAAAGVLAAASASVAAAALDGAFTGPTGIEVEFADGVIHVTLPDGATFESGYAVDGDTITVTTTAEEAACAGTSGTYSFVESETGVTFTLVEDECESRIADVTAGEWVRAGADEEAAE